MQVQRLHCVTWPYKISNLIIVIFWNKNMVIKMFTCACTAILHKIVMRAQIWRWKCLRCWLCFMWSVDFFLSLFFFFLFFVSTPASFRLLYHLCRARPWRDSCPFAVMRVFLTSHSLRSEDRAWNSLSTGQLVTKLHYRRESWMEGDASKTSLCFFYRWTCIKAIAVVSLSFSIHFSELFVVKTV